MRLARVASVFVALVLIALAGATVADTGLVGGGSGGGGGSTPAGSILRKGAALTDASATISPGTDAASEYDLSATLTANRTLTIAITSCPNNHAVTFVRNAGTGAFTLTILDGGPNGNALAVFAASPTVKQQATIVFNGSDFVPGSFEYLQ